MSKTRENVKFLLVNPWIVDFKAFDLWLKPLGLLYLSSILKRNGYRVDLIDCMDRNHPSVRFRKKIRQDKTGKFERVVIEKPAPYKKIPRRYKRYGIPIESFKKDLDRIPRPDVILVTSIMTYWYPGVHLAIKILKERFPGVPVFLGGIYATLCSDFATKNSGADFVFKSSNLKDFLGKAGEITGALPTFVPTDSTQFPRPDFTSYTHLDYGCVMTSAGCPYSCTYCASKKLQEKFIKRDPQDVVDEIVCLAKKKNVEHFAFYDDALLVDPDKHIIPILERLTRPGKGFKFHTPNGLHASFINRDLAELMKKSGFQTVRLSLETVSEKTLSATGAKVNPSDVEWAVENLLGVGFTPRHVAIYVMMGIPGQTPDEVERTLDFTFGLGVQSRLSVYSPVPGTPDFEKVKSVFPGNLRDPLYHNNTYHRYVGNWADYKTQKQLRDKASRLNQQILEHST